MHYFSNNIVLDKKVQFVNALWARVCDILKIQKRLSTAYSSETDGSTKHINQKLENFLKKYIN